MRALISVWYPKERIAACSAMAGIHDNIRTAVFSKLLINNLVLITQSFLPGRMDADFHTGVLQEISEKTSTTRSKISMWDQGKVAKG